MVAVPPRAASQVLSVGLEDSAVAFTHVTVIDGSDSLPRWDQTVVVRGNRIVAVGPSRATSPPARSRVVDGRGKFLVPGFWDMHVHTDVPDGRDVLALYVVNGVTGVRDMAGRWEVLASWKREIQERRLLGPRIVASGPYLEGGDVPIPHLEIRSPNDASPAIDSLIRLGVDFVKIHGQLTPESYFAAARAARQRGIPFAGHVPGRVSAEEASDSGQHSLEHMLAIPTPCTRAESTALAPRYRVQAVLGRCTGASLQPLMARFVRNGTWVVPTLVAQYEIAEWPRRALPGDAFGRYLPDTLRRYVAAIFPMPGDVPPGAEGVGRRLLSKRLALVGEMYRAGVGVLAGTDAPLRNSPPGFGLHSELELLVQAGLTPFEALRVATLEPARFLGRLDSLGTVAVGKLADLVLLDADPLRDIRNTRRVAAVVLDGRFLGPQARDSILRRRGTPPAAGRP
jgi:imidazolonepropionase-like amidohydrolase